MRPLIVPIILIVLISCSRTTERVDLKDTKMKDSSALDFNHPTELKIQEIFPDFVNNLTLPDSLLIDVDNVLYGDFNADQTEDFASMVTNLENGFQGVLIIHNSATPDYVVFGAGQEVNGMNNLSWIDEFRLLSKGEIVTPTMVDSQTGDIIGPDKTKEFRLIGNGIYMHVDEADGGGIIFWNGSRYEWYHLE